uniref:RanBP2-type domain-containing protein n=1 Tax=Panagrellus redivivus TaxID=6233 RepID=A0A7E4V7L5_PANRE
MAQSGSNNEGARTGSWFTNGFSRLSNIFGNGSNASQQQQQRKRTLEESINGSAVNASEASQPSPRASSLGSVKRIRRSNDPIASDLLPNTRLNSSVRDSLHDPIAQSSLNTSNRSVLEFPGRRSILDFQNSSFTPSQKKPTRAKQILDILDKIETSTTSINDESLNFSKTQKWLEDINVIKATPPPRKSLRTPSRLSSIIANARPKPSWQRAQSNQAPAEKPTETSFEEQEDPGDVSPVPTSSKKLVKPTPYTVGSHLESHRGESRSLKSSSGKNILRATDDIFEVDTNDRATMEQLLAVKPTFPAPPPSAYRSKPRSFKFTLPVLRGPQVVVESIIEEQISADSAVNSDDDVLSEESRVSTPDKNTEGTKTPTSKFNSETSSSVASDADQTITPPKSVETPKATTPSKSKWECPSCMTENTADACECCETPRPKPWTCKECFVDNAATDSTCTCCGSAPAGAAASAAPAAPAFKAQDFTKTAPVGGGFKFGLTAPAAALPSDTPQSTVTDSAADSSTPAKPAGAFTFGVKPAEITPAPTSAPAPKLTFGLPAAVSTAPATTTESTSTPAGSSLFGAKPAQNLPLFGTSSTTTPNTGTPVTSETATSAAASTLFAPNAAATTTPSTGLFGSTSTSSASGSSLFGVPTSTTAAPSLFGATPAATTAPAPATGFGAAPVASTAPSTLFGAAAPSSTSAPTPFGAASVSAQPASFGTSAAPQPLFGGAASATPANGLFGATTPAAPAAEAPKSNGFNFGSQSASTPSFGTNGTATSSTTFGSFGNANNATNGDAPPEKRANNFGSQPALPAFGAPAAGFDSNTNANGFNFGSANAPASFSFGAQQPAQNGGTFLFGAGTPAAPQAPILFGAGAVAAPQAPIQFGSGAPATPQAPIQFGAGAPAVPQFGALPTANAFTHPGTTTNRRILKPSYRRRN